MSFKYGNCTETRNGRVFTDMDTYRLHTLLAPIKGFSIVDSTVSTDARKERETEKWFNVVLKKTIY